MFIRRTRIEIDRHALVASRADNAIITCVLRRVHSRRTELNRPEQVDPVRRRVIGHARQRHEADWLQFNLVQCSAVYLL